ncbi:MAG: hypothetical protein H0X63_12375, partial [Flavobacteriales bacterium]|nr:hypothetical protein [Flavobacteriales bacterium]
MNGNELPLSSHGSTTFPILTNSPQKPKIANKVSPFPKEEFYLFSPLSKKKIITPNRTLQRIPPANYILPNPIIFLSFAKKQIMSENRKMLN